MENEEGGKHDQILVGKGETRRRVVESSTHDLVFGRLELSSGDDILAKEGIGGERSSKTDDCENGQRSVRIEDRKRTER